MLQDVEEKSERLRGLTAELKEALCHRDLAKVRLFFAIPTPSQQEQPGTGQADFDDLNNALVEVKSERSRALGEAAEATAAASVSAQKLEALRSELAAAESGKAAAEARLASERGAAAAESFAKAEERHASALEELQGQVKGLRGELEGAKEEARLAKHKADSARLDAIADYEKRINEVAPCPVPALPLQCCGA